MYYLKCDGYGIIEEFAELPSVEDVNDTIREFFESEFDFTLLDEEENDIPFPEPEF